MRRRIFAGTLIEVPGGSFALQQRDKKPDIANPGMVGIFGGALEGDETPEAAAFRELGEETSLEDLVLRHLGVYHVTEENRFGEAVKKEIHAFWAQAPTADFEVKEGAPQPFIIPFDANLSAYPLSPGTREMLEDYRNMRNGRE